MPENVVNGEHREKINEENQENDDEVDPQFEPIVNLPLIEVSNNEEDEVEMLKLRAKLYRYDSSNDPAEWKERGTGDVKLLRHKTKHSVRVVMRRDKTLKICANHFVTPWMELKPNCGSDRAWVWSVLADYADEQLKPELLAIRFANAENASLWKETFEKAKHIVGTECSIYAGNPNPDDLDDDSHSDSCSYVTNSEESDGETEIKLVDKEKNLLEDDNHDKVDSIEGKIKEKNHTANDTSVYNVVVELEKLEMKEKEQEI